MVTAIAARALGWGIVGYGWVARDYAAPAILAAGHAVRAVCDPSPAARGAALAALSPAGGAHADLGPLLADPEVDAIYVATPNHLHRAAVEAAAAAGKAVLCEKPIDLDIARVDACRSEIGSLTDRVMVGFNRRFDPSFADVRARVAAGEIGELEQLTIISRDPAPPPAAYVATSGGLFRDMTIHDLYMARFFLGEIVEVTARGANLVSAEIASAGDVDGAVTVLRGESGALCTIVNSRRCAFGYDQRLEAFGARGMLSAANQLPTSVRFSGAEATEVAAPYLTFFLDRYTPAYRAELDAFVTAVETRTAPSPGFADGRAALVLADAAGESLRTGTTVAV